MSPIYRDSQNQYRELVENARIIILRLDSDGKITFLNGFAEKLFGYSRDEVIGRNIVGSILAEEHDLGKSLAEMIQEIALQVIANQHDSKDSDASGAVGNGKGLLVGLLGCQRCGRKMHVRYSIKSGLWRRCAL